MSSLREQGNRNLSLLRMLSYNIVKYNNALNLKQCATLLYSMAILNFPDKVHYVFKKCNTYNIFKNLYMLGL